MTMVDEFRRRATFEAHRYGGDDWVFVRELLQNSRDAGASRVEITIDRLDGRDRIVVRDDGCGMTFDHARKYLFTLYASSKRGQDDTAGRFGIGFWAVLRFEPDEVVVRSAQDGASGWEFRLSGDLEEVERRESPLTTGTEIELMRRSRGDDPIASVWHAVHRDARHLRRRDGGGEILEVWVNSTLATSEIELDPPSLSFSRSGLRGEVALADQPRVDLLAHGLRVRTTATLDELLTQPDSRRRRAPCAPDGLVPRVVLDSRRLQVLMARGDARTDRELRRLVGFGRRGVRRLVRDQLDQEAGSGFLTRARMCGFELASSPWIRRAGAGLAAAVAITTAAWWLIESGSVSTDDLSPGKPGTIVQPLRPPDEVLQADAADRYSGPAADPFQTRPAEISLRYQPSAAQPMLAVFRVVDLADDGRIVPAMMGSGLRAYLGAACDESCLDIVLDLDGVSGDIRLPVPTGHLLDPASVVVGGVAGTLRAAPDGGPLLVVEKGIGGRVEYRTGAGVDSQSVVGRGSWPRLPAAANDVALSLRPLQADEAARLATDWVRRHVAYDTSDQTVERHRAAARDGLSFGERCLAVGAGDCDVQNALLAAVLARAGVPVQMAVGFVGAGGRALPGLHAWVEYRRDGGVWRAVDASRGASPGFPSPRSSRGGGADGEETEGGFAVQTEEIPDQRAGAPVGKRLLVAVLVALLAIGVVTASRRRLKIDHVSSTGGPDLAGLLRGALARPEAYREIPTLFARPLVPSLAGSAFSLDRAQVLARRGRLAVSFRASDLAHRAAKKGLGVIDGRRLEGDAVAAALGAVDLDRWDGIVNRGEENSMTLRVGSAAARVGETWQVVVNPELSCEVAILDGPLAGRGRRHRIVAVDNGSELWTRVARLAEIQPCAATLLLADRITECMRMAPERRRRLLAQLASEAVIEWAGVNR